MKKEQSTYAVVQRKTSHEEWVIEISPSNIVQTIKIQVPKASEYTLAGITFISQADSVILHKLLIQAVKQSAFEELYWDELLKSNLSMFSMRIYPVPPLNYFEVDTVEDYYRLEKQIKELRKSNVISSQKN